MFLPNAQVSGLNPPQSPSAQKCIAGAEVGPATLGCGMSEMLATRPSLRTSILEAALDMRDRIGVLTAYSGVPPAGLNGSGPSQISLSEQVEQIYKSAAGRGIGDTNDAVRECLLDMKPTLDLMGRSTSDGQGRALFCGVESGQVLTTTAATPFTPLATVRRKAFVLPLLCALERSCVNGVAVLDGDGVRVLEAEGGAVEEIAHLELEPSLSSYRQGALAVHELARAHSWREVVLLGQSVWLEDFKRLLEERGTERVIVDQRSDEDLADIAGHVIRLVIADRARYQNTLVSFLLRELTNCGQVRAGLNDARRAIATRRATAVVFDRESCSGVGWRFNESLERLIEMALSDGVKVVALDAEAAERIRPYEGVIVRVGWSPTYGVRAV